MTRISTTIFLTLLILSGCTSLGHEARTEPQIEKRLTQKPNRVYFTGSGELAIAIELLLTSNGIDVVYSTPQSGPTNSEADIKNAVRYAINATSVDHDMCIPEGSRQMHFYISVVDIQDNKRVFAMSGDYGCKDTITNRFEKWLLN